MGLSTPTENEFLDPEGFNPEIRDDVLIIPIQQSEVIEIKRRSGEVLKGRYVALWAFKGTPIEFMDMKGTPLYDVEGWRYIASKGEPCSVENEPVSERIIGSLQMSGEWGAAHECALLCAVNEATRPLVESLEWAHNRVSSVEAGDEYWTALARLEKAKKNFEEQK